MTRIPSSIQATGNTTYLVPPTVLKAEGLVKIYGKRRVVDGVSLHVNKGEVVGLLGPNGAGKTTSFRMTCGLIDANEGIVYLNGKDATNWPLYRRAREGGMGYLPQEPSVFKQLSVQDNLLGMMEMLGLNGRMRREKCDSLLEKMKLTHLRKNPAKGLSGGERRRLEIARALVADPKIILLDEPFAAIDPITVQNLQVIIRQLGDEGISILITDHKELATLEITDRCYIIASGKVLCSGKPDEVLANEEAQHAYFGNLATKPGQTQTNSGETPLGRAAKSPRSVDNFDAGHSPKRPSRPARPAMPDLNDYSAKASVKENLDVDADFDDSFEDYKSSRRRPTVKVRSPQSEVPPRAELLGAEKRTERLEKTDRSDKAERQREPHFGVTEKPASKPSSGTTPGGVRQRTDDPSRNKPQQPTPRVSLLGRMSGIFKKPTDSDDSGKKQ